MFVIPLPKVTPHIIHTSILQPFILDENQQKDKSNNNYGDDYYFKGHWRVIIGQFDIHTINTGNHSWYS